MKHRAQHDSEETAQKQRLERISPSYVRLREFSKFHDTTALFQAKPLTARDLMSSWDLIVLREDAVYDVYLHSERRDGNAAVPLLVAVMGLGAYAGLADAGHSAMASVAGWIAAAAAFVWLPISIWRSKRASAEYKAMSAIVDRECVKAFKATGGVDVLTMDPVEREEALSREEPTN